MSTLIIAEKPSVGLAISSVIGAKTTKKDTSRANGLYTAIGKGAVIKKVINICSALCGITALLSLVIGVRALTLNVLCFF